MMPETRRNARYMYMNRRLLVFVLYLCLYLILSLHLHAVLCISVAGRFLMRGSIRPVGGNVYCSDLRDWLSGCTWMEKKRRLASSKSAFHTGLPYGLWHFFTLPLLRCVVLYSLIVAIIKCLKDAQNFFYLYTILFLLHQAWFLFPRRCVQATTTPIPCCIWT